MLKIIVLISLLISGQALSQECDKYQKEADSLMKEFNTVKDKMSEPGITREEYDDLYSIYTATWDDIVNAQQEHKKCVESQKRTVTVKVEPNRVNSPLPRLFNVRWASDRVAVREVLRKIDDVEIKDSDQSVLDYTGGKFLSYNVETWQFNFFDQKLYACQIILKTPQNTNSFRLYEKIREEFTKIYGEPSYQRNQFPAGYKDDRIKLNAIKNKTVTVYTRWLFQKDDSIRIGFHEDGSVMITYIVDAIYQRTR